MASLGTLPPFINSTESDFYMMHYEPEARDLRMQSTTPCAEMAKVVESAPKGRWFFFAGKIPSDFHNLTDALATLGLVLKVDPKDVYFVAVGIKDVKAFEFVDFSESWMSGTGRICLTQHLHKMKEKKALELMDIPDDDTKREKCVNCKRCPFISVKSNRTKMAELKAM